MGESGAAEDGLSARDLLADPRLLILLGINLVVITGNLAVLPAIPAIGTAFEVSDARIGLVMTAFTLPTAIAIPVMGVLADLHGRRAVVVPSLALFGASGVITPLMPSFEALLVLRAVQGIGFAGSLPLTVTMIGDFFSGTTGATAQGLRSSSSGIGNLAAPAIAGVLVLVAWHTPFLLYGLAFLVCAVAYVALPEPVSGDRPPGVIAQLREYGDSIRREVGDRSVAVLIGGGFLVFFVRYALLTFVPLFTVRELGASAAAAGVILSVRGVARIVVSPFAGAVTARFSDRWGLVGALAVITAALVLIPAAPSVLALGALVGLYGLGGSITNPVMNNGVTQRTVAETRAGVVSGLNGLRNAGKAAGPAALGVALAWGGFEAVFWSSAAIAAGYAVVVAVILEPIE